MRIGVCVVNESYLQIGDILSGIADLRLKQTHILQFILIFKVSVCVGQCILILKISD